MFPTKTLRILRKNDNVNLQEPLNNALNLDTDC